MAMCRDTEERERERERERNKEGERTVGENNRMKQGKK